MTFTRLRLALLVAVFLGCAGFFFWKFQAEQPAAQSYLIPLPANARAVAVFPFQVAQPAWRTLGDGVAHLLSARLGGNGELRRISPHAVWSRVQRLAPQGVDANAGATIAGQLGAAAYVLGNLSLDGERLSLSATWYDLTPAGPATEAKVEGPLEQLTDLVDKLGEQLTAGRVVADAVRIARVAVVTSQVPVALRSYLDGEAAIAAGHYDEALKALNAAVEADPQFGLAYFRLAEVASWSGTPEIAEAARQQALLLSNRLPPQERLLIDIELDEVRGQRDSARQRYRDLLSRAPDEWEAWLRLGEIDEDRGAARQSFEKARALVPDQPVVQERVGGPR